MEYALGLPGTENCARRTDQIHIFRPNGLWIHKSSIFTYGILLDLDTCMTVWDLFGLL